MPDFLNKISEQITSFWNRFNGKQKIQIISALVVIGVALTIVVLALNQKKMVPFVSGLEPRTTSQVKALLQENGISYEVRDNASSIYVDAKRKQDAQMAVDSVGVISNTGMAYKDIFNKGLSTTQSERDLMAQLAFENELNGKIATIQGIESANVKIVVPSEDRTIFDDAKEAKATAILTTSTELTKEQVFGIANFLASAIDNLDVQNVRILDHTGNLLYYGEDSNDGMAGLSSKIEYEIQLENKVKKDVLTILLGEFDDAAVAADLVIDFDTMSSVSEAYDAPAGQNKGMVTNEYSYDSQGSNEAASGVPGTDSNTGTDYLVPDSGSSNSSVKIVKNEYENNKTITEAKKDPGVIKYNESTVTISAKKHIIYDEALLKKQGALADVTWEEFKVQNKAWKKVAIDPELVALVENVANGATVKIMGYEVPTFVPMTVTKKPIIDYLFIAIIAIMIGLLGYAVYKGTEPVEVTEIQPELSVEDMLASTKEQQDLVEIEYDEKSETRVQIEKFVDEKPDAVAQLLRNWLNEDWE